MHQDLEAFNVPLEGTGYREVSGSLCVCVCVCVCSLSQSALILPFLHLSCSCLQFWSLYYGRRCIFMSLDEIWVRVTEEHADCQRHFTVYVLQPTQRDWGSSKKSNQPSTDRLMISDWAGWTEKQKTWAKQREVDRLLIVLVIIWIVSFSLQRNMTGFIFVISMRIAGEEWGGKSVIADSIGIHYLFI